MPPIDTQRSSHVKAGAFVLTALLIFVVVMIMLSGGVEWWHRTNTYTVRFPIEVGAAGLAEGSEVRVGGRPVGRVRDIKLVFDDPARAPVGVDVHVKMPRSLPVFEDAVALLEKPIFGSNAVINFPVLGGAPGEALLTEGSRIMGTVAPPELLRNTGYGPEQATQLRGIMQRMDDVSRRAVAVIERFEQEVLPNFKGATEDVRAITADVRERSGPWLDRADTLTHELTELSTEARATVQDARAFIANLNTIVIENQESFTRTLERLESASENADQLLARLNEESVTLLNDMLAEGRRQVEAAGDVVDRVTALVAQESPQVRTALSNLRLASEQMKLTMGEVRRSPWRLLYRPKTNELEYELLYDTARTYASAVSDLRAASESLESSIAGDGSRLATNGRPLEDVVTEIHDAFERYRAAEEKFLRTLMLQNVNGN